MSRIVVVIAGSPAIHKLGDISRDHDDFFAVHEEDGDTILGNWMTGLGFINVRVAREHTRKLTHEEADRIARARIQIGDMVSDPIHVDPRDVEPGWSPRVEESIPPTIAAEHVNPEEPTP